MKINKKEQKGNLVTLEVEADWQEFKTALEQAIRQAAKSINIPGFRPGKAPRKLLEQHLNMPIVEDEAAHRLIADLYPAILKETEIEPIDYPSVELVGKKEKEALVFKVKIEVSPEVKLGKYKGVKVEQKSTEVADGEVLHLLKSLQSRFAKLENEGQEQPLNDEFAKKVSRYSTLAELKEEMKANLKKEKEMAVEGEVKDKIIEEVAEGAKVDIPEALVKRETEQMLAEFERSLSQSKLTLDGYLKSTKKNLEELKESMRESAAKRVKSKLVLEAVGEKEKIEVSEEEIEGEIKRFAEEEGRPFEEFKKTLPPSARDYMVDYLKRQKALQFLHKHAKISRSKESKKLF